MKIQFLGYDNNGNLVDQDSWVQDLTVGEWYEIEERGFKGEYIEIYDDIGERVLLTNYRLKYFTGVVQ